MIPGFFSGLVMKFLMRKKQAASRFYEGMVSISSVKQHPQRPNFWNWQVGSFESERLLDWLGEHERCLITQRERKTITGKAGLAPRVILVCRQTRVKALIRALILAIWIFSRVVETQRNVCFWFFKTTILVPVGTQCIYVGKFDI